MIVLSLHPDAIQVNQPTQIALRLANKGLGTCTNIRLSFRLSPEIIMIGGKAQLLRIEHLEKEKYYDYQLHLKATQEGTFYLQTTNFSYTEMGRGVRPPQVALAVHARPVQKVEKQKALISVRAAEKEITPSSPFVREAAADVLRRKVANGDFDVFLCHNNKDKPVVKEIGERLKERGILPWLDEWELRPGLPWQRALELQIKNIKAAAVFVGKSGIGPWQNMEQAAFIQQFVKRECPVIPVILRDCEKSPELPPLLDSMTWVDFRKDDPEPMEQLIWGITGEHDMTATKDDTIKSMEIV